MKLTEEPIDYGDGTPLHLRNDGGPRPTRPTFEFAVPAAEAADAFHH
jgi:hypothetical protein